MDELEQLQSNDATVIGTRTKTESNGTTGPHVTAVPVTTYMPSEALVPMPVLPQSGAIIVGPGAKKEAQLLGLGLIKLRSKQKDWLADAKKYAKEQSIKQVLLRQTLAHQQNQQKVAMYAQALSLMARVYIGSISFEVREEMIKNAFGVFGPIKSINMSWDAVTGHHKGFAFLEYEIPEAALLAQESMNGVLMGGRNLKVGRPSNMPQAQPIIEMVMQEAKAYHRVYVASVHPDLSESDLKSVFEAFGEVTKCQLARATGPNAGSGHRGFGYLEFSNAQSANEAIAGMNMFDLGGQYLRVGKCITPPDALTYIVPTSAVNLPTAAAVAAAEVTAKIQAEEMTAKKSPVHTASTSPLSGGIAVRQGSPQPYNMQATPPVGVVTTVPPIGIATVPMVGLATVSPVAAGKPYSPTVVSPTPPPSATVIPNQISTPPLPVATPPLPPGPPPGGRRGFGGFAVQTPPVQVVSIPPPQVITSIPAPASTIPVPPPPVSSIPPPPVTLSSTQSLISRINIGTPTNSSVEPATFAPLPANIAPVDRKAITTTADGIMDQLAIGQASTSDSASMALVVSDNSIPSRRDLQKTGGTSKEKGSKPDDRSYKKKKKKPVSTVPKGPQLNTPQALEAANRAGELNDQMAAQNANSDDVSLAAQEGLEIRGNDARHLLMHKLMRTNRSTVIVLRNMVTIEECDDELEGEIRDECNKYGKVQEVVIAQDPANGSVKIFVRFDNTQEADTARQALDKRYFAGREISAQNYDQILFDHNDYSG
ncbi:Poly(U)-binding-splicing factor half pint, variant [Loa loa]|uniref:Poly(U)-binding-splicing factor half pint, variant n=1 Tax=Loa loa TaxID=7209 RepID=A0A1I7VST9_LOALO|nr:Poly(U)-binding-splicing factor half pint, variant [Loa loa]EJD75402.1 Poly(U)-binding-splicing factor half pint, variant [Loa loa]